MSDLRTIEQQHLDRAFSKKNREMEDEDAINEAKQAARLALEDDVDVIEQVIIDNADLIQDFRFKYLEKLRHMDTFDSYNKRPQLNSDFGEKVLDQ